MGSGRMPDPSPSDMGTIARAGGIMRFLSELGPGERFPVAQAAEVVQMSWHATRYQLEMISQLEPLRQNDDSSWQLYPRHDLDW